MRLSAVSFATVCLTVLSLAGPTHAASPGTNGVLAAGFSESGAAAISSTAFS